MQLVREYNTLTNIRKTMDQSVNKVSADVRSNSLEMKEKLSSDASLMLMAVASGDNVATMMNSGHKLKDTPSLVPCCEGKELQINEDLVSSGLSAISVKHEGLIQCLSVSHACDRLQIPPGLVKHRNSFRSLHRPDLKRVPYLRRMTSDELEKLFRGYSNLPTRCPTTLDTREELTKTILLPKSEHSGNKDDANHTEGTTITSLNPIPETKSGEEDVPAGMRLHGARARLYTSVLAGSRTGDQNDDHSINEEIDYKVPALVDPVPEDEVQFNEELQIILPPRCEEVCPDTSVTTTTSAAM